MYTKQIRGDELTLGMRIATYPNPHSGLVACKIRQLERMHNGVILVRVEEAAIPISFRADSLVSVVDTSRCPDCGHAAHGSQCYNLASDNDCSCTHDSGATAQRTTDEDAANDTIEFRDATLGLQIYGYRCPERTVRFTAPRTIDQLTLVKEGAIVGAKSGDISLSMQWHYAKVLPPDALLYLKPVPVETEAIDVEANEAIDVEANEATDVEVNEATDVETLNFKHPKPRGVFVYLRYNASSLKVTTASDWALETDATHPPILNILDAQEQILMQIPFALVRYVTFLDLLETA